MTALSGPITFNSSTGSDSTSSGCGPATPVSVTIQTSASSNTATASPTTGYSVGDIMYVPSFTGRQFNVIASITSGSLTFDQNWEDSSTGASAYVGGKRATLENSTKMFRSTGDSGMGGYMEVDLETDQTLTQAINGVGGNGTNIEWRSSQLGVKRTITTSSTYLWYGGTHFLRDIHLKSTNSAGKVFFAGTNGLIQNANVILNDCIVGDASDSFETFGVQAARSVYVRAYKTVFQNFTDRVSNGLTHPDFFGCAFLNNAGYVHYRAGTSGSSNTYSGCLFANNPYLFYLRWGSSMRFTNNIVYNCGTSAGAFVVSKADTERFYGDFYNNLFVGCTQAINTNDIWIAKDNFYYNNGFSFTNEVNPTTLSADPFVDAANGDFNLNNALGGGATLRSTKYTLGG